jgi:chemotaxis protein MotB
LTPGDAFLTEWGTEPEMAGKPKEEVKTDTNTWMTTYTDLTTLLLTFFVLLLSIATIDEQNKRIALNSLVGAFGFKPGAQSIIGSPDGMNITLGTPPMKPEEIAYEKLQNVVLKNTLEEEVTVQKEADRVVLSLGKRVLFQEGSSRIQERGKAFLNDLAPVLQGEEPRLIELRGYAAHAESVFERDPERSAMLLSSRRALAVFGHFTEEAGIPAEELVAHGFGRDPHLNRGTRNRGKLDRQVQIILDFSEEVPFRMKRPAGDSILDFKGFLFRFPGDAGG